MSGLSSTKNFMVVKKPGDASIYTLQEILKEAKGETVVLGLHKISGSELVEKLEQVGEFHGAPVNLVFDLTSVENLASWATPIVSIMHSNVVGGRELPHGSLIVCIVRDEETLKDSVAYESLSARCQCVASKTDPESFRNLAREIKDLRNGLERVPQRDSPGGTDFSM